MIKLDTPHESFIGGWYIDEKICDNLIQLFKDNKEHQKQGVIGGPFNVNKEHKNSTDLGLHPEYDNPAFMEYKEALKILCLSISLTEAEPIAYHEFFLICSAIFNLSL